MPFMLNASVPFLNLKHHQRNRFFAIGYDAFEISLLLNTNTRRKVINLKGLTGNISIDKTGKITRQSLKTKVVDGQLEILGY